MTTTTVETATLPRAQFEAQLEKFLTALNEAEAARMARDFPTLSVETFSAMRGPKMVRVVAGSTGRGRHVHCFVEIATGKVIKAAGWKAPAKRSNGEWQSQFDIATDEGLATLMAAWQPYGGHLYVR